MADSESEQSEGPAFEAEVKIGKGFRTLDRHGVATIDDGRLTLRKGKGEVIVEVPMSEIQAESMVAGAAARIIVGDDKYAIEPTKMRRFDSATLGGSARNLGSDIARFKQGRAMTEAFLAAVQAQGGSVKS